MNHPFFQGFTGPKLTDQQADAVTCRPGPVLVIAGAGSGKTTVMAHRCLYLHRQREIDLERILCVTFTRQAVANLKEKLGEVDNQYPVDAHTKAREKVPVMTFHGLCKSFLRDVYAKKGESEVKFLHQSKIVESARKIMVAYPHITAIAYTTELIIKMRGICKFHHRTFTEDELLHEAVKLYHLPEEQLKLKFPYSDMLEIYDKLDQALKDARQGTLDDIILDAYNYMSNDDDADELLEGLCSKYDAILCDEFQDVDNIQFELLKKLSKNHHNLFCVGDPDQSIFGFRGSVQDIFPRLQKYFNAASVYTQIKKLETNFRSTPQILTTANELINVSKGSEEYKKSLITENADGPRPMLSVLSTAKTQAAKVVDRINQLRNEGVSLDSIIVLGRNRAHYKAVKDAFMRQAIPFVDWRDEFHTHMDCAEIKDLLHCLGVAFIRDDEKKWWKSLSRIREKMKVGVGNATWDMLNEDGPDHTFANIEKYSTKKTNVDALYQRIRKLREIADDNELSMKEKCKKIAHESGIVDYYTRTRSDSKRNKVDTIEAFLDSEFIAKASNWKDAFSMVMSFMQDDNRRLVCSTIHSVKGLEFDHVLVVSLSQGNLPSKRGLQQCKTPEQENDYVEEERRLLYVAVTRAKKTLHLFSDKPVDRWCPFLDDIDHTLDRKEISAVSYNVPKETLESEVENEAALWEDSLDPSIEVDD